MARKAKAVDIYKFGDIEPYMDDDKLFARERYPVLKDALSHAIQLNSILPENWQMRDTRARFNDIKLTLEGGTPPENISHWDVNNIYSVIASYDETVQQGMNAKFFAWYDSNPQFAPVYATCKENHWISWQVGGKTYSQEQAVRNGWLQRPPSFNMFRQVMRQGEARKYMELNRALPFEEGDIVFLRKPYANRWRIDPFPEMDANDVRFGTVLELTEDTKNWRANKGSRMISVLWHGSPNQKKIVPVRCLKLSARAGPSK